MDSTLIDILWILLCAGLVFLMQGGFLCLESGLTRSKNSINVAFKNVIDFGIAFLLYWMISYGLMFGESAGGWVGTSGFFFQPKGDEAPLLYSVFIFQAMFCATGATIISGATAERLRLYAYVVITILYSLLVYPFVGHWVWSSNILGEPAGWLAKQGFHDFAGSSVVHSTGGWVALAIILIMGPRIGRFDEKGKAVEIPGSNMPMAMLGAVILVFGWFGFNGGSVLGFTTSVPLILANTFLGSVAGMVTIMAITPITKKLPDPALVMNGAIAGLVAITANCDYTGPVAAIIIGAVGALIMWGTTRLLEALGIDDAIGAVPAHLTPGIWGTLAVALFADPEVLGAPVDRVAMFQTQLIGVVIIGFWSFVLAFAFLWLINKVYPFRVSAEDERMGLNVSEHGARTEIVFLLEDMEHHARTGDLSKRVNVEPFTEVGQIARQYNKVIDALDLSMNRLKAIFRDLNDGIITFTRDGLLTSMNPAAARLFGLEPAAAGAMPVVDVLTAVHRIDVEAYQPIDSEPLDLYKAGAIQEIHYKGLNSRKDQVIEFTASEGRWNDQVIYTGLVRDISETIHAQRSKNRLMSKLFGAQKLQLFALMCRQALPDIRRLSGDIRERLRDSAGQENLLHNATRIETLTQDLRYLEERDLLPVTPVLLDALVDDLLRDPSLPRLHPVLAEVEIETELRGGEFTALASERYLRQVLTNLLVFAASESRDSGKVSLAVTPRFLDHPLHGSEIVPAGEYLVITIRDSGAGLPEQELDHLFEAGKDETRFPLVLSEAMIRYMGGVIDVDSTLGEGTTFTIHLRLGRDIGEKPVPEKPIATVLLVDDHEEQHELLGAMLQGAGYRVLHAANAVEVASVQDEAIDLVLLDLVLARDRKASPQVFHRIKNARPNLPVIVTCGEADKDVLADVIRSGAAGFVEKPISTAKLLRLVKRELSVTLD
jgi:ammonium transporter